MSLLVHPQKTVHEQIAKMKSRIIQNRMQKKRENREKVVIINSFDAGFDCLVQFKNRKNSKNIWRVGCFWMLRKFRLCLGVIHKLCHGKNRIFDPPPPPMSRFFLRNRLEIVRHVTNL
jgi:hypothetical protein